MVLGTTNTDLSIKLEGHSILFTNRWFTGLETFKIKEDGKILSKRFSLIGDIHPFELDGINYLAKYSYAWADFANQLYLYRDEELIAKWKVPFWRRFMDVSFDKSLELPLEVENPLRKFGLYLWIGVMGWVIATQHLYVKIFGVLFLMNFIREAYLYFNQFEIVEEDETTS